MTRYILLTSFLISTALSQGQIVISETFNGSDISGSIINVIGAPQSDDIEHSLYVTNNTDESVSLKVRRFEEGVEPGTTNNICWLLCPADPQLAGENPDWVTTFAVNLEPGQTDSSFAIHYDPNGGQGCSTFRVQWVDAVDNDQSFTQVYFRIIHGSEDCAAVGLNEFSEDLDVIMSPNPANDITTIELDGVDRPLTMMVIDVLGQVVLEEDFNPAQNRRTVINTSAMRNGIYFVSIADNARTLKTLKLVVKH